MGKLFGTDGIRGVVGENLTAEMAFRVGQAVACVLAEDSGQRPVILIGKDTRISSFCAGRPPADPLPAL